MKTQLTLYNNLNDKQGSIITFEDYLLRIKFGSHTAQVKEARKHEHGSDDYVRAKNTLPLVMGSAIMNIGGGKSAKNINKLNGLIFLDIDEEITSAQLEKIKADKHTFALHCTIGGYPKVTSVIKINIDRFEDTWQTAADYYYTNFGVSVDESCKNRNRIRFLSFDENPYVNVNASLFRAKSIKKFEPPKQNLTKYIFSENDFGNIINQIQERGVNLAESYEDYIKVGMSLASKFGESGFEYFDAICQLSTKYNYKRGARDYKGFCQNIDGRITIGTFYYLCKQQNIELYSPRTIKIINSVKVGKAQGNPTKESVLRHLSSLGEHEIDESEEDLISRLIEDKEDYSTLANENMSEVDILINFIISMYNPYRCEISDNIHLEDGTYMDDRIIKDVYISCKSNLDSVKVTMDEVRTILTSSKIRGVNSLLMLINNYKDTRPTGYIDKYIEAIPADTEEIKQYNKWAFKRWLCGAVHNWTRRDDDFLISPLTLVLTGGLQGAGKTSFFEYILPRELRQFFAESKISDKLDNMRRMGTHLILVDNEFSGDGTKNQGVFKSLVDSKTIVARFAYGFADKRVTRRCAIGGTTNETDILKDDTGNRRILPIQVKSRVDYDLVTNFPSELMIAEAYNLLQDGFEWVIRDKKDMNYIAEICSENIEINPVEELFFSHFRLEECNDFYVECYYNQGELLQFMNNNSKLIITPADLKRIYTKYANVMPYKNYRDGASVRKCFNLWGKIPADGLVRDITAAEDWMY